MEPTSHPHHIATVGDPRAPKHTNRLIHETSPYLLQHAHNPVDWFPWNDETLAKARAENKPIFLSVGYSACHWCHVMEHESFEDEETAALLNRYFVAIKVDREERPDIDEIYMTAVQLLTGSGGWPMTVFLTPELQPFFGGTYFPPEDRWGRPGFRSIVRQLSDAWVQKRDQVARSAQQITEAIRAHATMSNRAGIPLTKELLTNAAAELRRNFDSRYGGFGTAPKFPPSRSISLLLRHANRHGQDANVMDMVAKTLDAMASGGMYDQVGGGFHRYSVDEKWLVPHFEKMLYDNALLAQTYIEAYQLTRNPSYRRVAMETLEYVMRDMTDPRGGFYASEDADSEGKEGMFYLWTHDEIIDVLGGQDGPEFVRHYQVEKQGNFTSHESYHRGLNILHLSLESAAADESRMAAIEASKQKLLAVRDRRQHPGKDDKIILSWNALMISALAMAYQAFRDERYLCHGTGAAQFIIGAMMRDNQLLRIHCRGASKIAANLEDYSYLVLALTDLYQSDFNLFWLETADRLAREMIAKFWDEGAGGLFFTEAGSVDVLVRTKSDYDGAIPSGNSIAAMAFLRLAKLLDQADYFTKAQTLLERSEPALRRAPQGFQQMLLAADFYLYPAKEIAIRGERTDPRTIALLNAAFDLYIPNKVVAWLDPNDSNRALIEKRVPLLAGKSLVAGQPAAFVCKNFACTLPVTTVDELRQLLMGP